MSKSKTLTNQTKSGYRAGDGTGVETSRHLLRLYVTGTTAGSTRAIQQVRKVCEEHLHGRYDLEVIDIYQLPSLAKHDQIIATPTLIKVLPAPLRRLIGDLSDVNRVLFGMDIREQG
jgi:circadian clock protein KaiB